MARVVDYTLYLVTDSTPAILGDRDLCHVVSEAILGGKPLQNAILVTELTTQQA
jgi:thiamine-phosphate diphosphorylase/hydroxyethylthiazole kinase